MGRGVSAAIPWWQRPVPMSRQSWASVAAAGGFILCVLLLAVVPVPYVTWAPGPTADTLGRDAAGQRLVEVTGVETEPTTGRLDLTTVSVSRVDTSVGLVEALLAWARPGFDTLDRNLYYPPGTTQEQDRAEKMLMMSTSRETARVAALAEAGRPATPGVVVVGVGVGGPAETVLRPGDFVLGIGPRGGVTGARPEDEATGLAQLTAALAGSADGVTLRVRRDGQDLTVQVGVRDGATVEKRLGIDLANGWWSPVQVTYRIDEAIGGPSAGLVFALAVYDQLVPGDLLQGRHVAGTGTIAADGRVGSIGGIQSKITAARAAGASLFLVPADNCPDTVGITSSPGWVGEGGSAMRLVKVATLREAITALQALQRPDAKVETC